MQEYREKRRNFALEFLGGTCVSCGEVNGLEFDHVDPGTKTDTIANLITAKMGILIAELEKCQLLCGPCHRDKTRFELGK